MFRWLAILSVMTLQLGSFAQDISIRGRFVSKGSAVPYASVALKGSSQGTSSDMNGHFMIELELPGNYVLVATGLGFVRKEISFKATSDAMDLGDIELVGDINGLEEVVITGTMREVSRSDSPVSVEVITPALFRKNPSPSLFDAVGMVNGVRPQINCSVCNTGDIHINGMEGPYTMVLIDGMPIVSGLSTVYGLSGIPTSLVERVEIVKGPGSSLYGSEAMGGLVNVITKDPVLAPRAVVDLMATTYQEYNADIGLRFGQKKVSDLLGVSVFNYSVPVDHNNDGFTDVTLQERVSLFNKFTVRRPDSKVASIAVRYVHEDRWGGDMKWTPAFAGSDSLYGENIATRRWEVIGQYQLPVPGNLTAQLSANGHQQRSFYGTTPYDADQRVFFAQLYGSKRFGARHDALYGLAYRYTWYDDNTIGTARYEGEVRHNAPQILPLPGLFLQDEWSVTETHKLLLGYRVDHDRNHGLVQSPRIAYKWAPNGRWAVRANFGTGYRVVNLFTEEHAALTGSRQVLIEGDLLPERSLNGTLNIIRKWPGEKRFFGLDGSLFYTHFSNRILPDYTTDQDQIIYRNLNGHGTSRGASLNLEARIGNPLRVIAGATWMQVFTVQDGISSTQYFAPEWSGTITASYEFPKQWTADLTGQWYGPMRLPIQTNDFRPEYSPTYALINLQVTHKFNDRFECYGGVKNMLNFMPRDPLMRPSDPFDRNANDPSTNPNGYTFDTSYMYAPVQGARGFIGVRWALN
ncbi:MAG: TonB-dependent receptor [Flavobacteriales bacterium]|nr:TonB-dependent receptor [Flavobacteriales bacterium]MBK6945245.1 TonB-dependent receptor [Flavobacteriales bacterium]MBK9535199.1 TonB-dependent receptor [Flavobacteriales bacterium]MBP9137825.1 TonB-dependent receptor [Flavobacteriales bacterium]